MPVDQSADYPPVEAVREKTVKQADGAFKKEPGKAEPGIPARLERAQEKSPRLDRNAARAQLKSSFF